MKFYITRTSTFLHDEIRPCDEAYPVTHETDRTIIDLWQIEIKTLDDLLQLYNKYGDLIIQESMTVPGKMEIEIYDSYRE